MGVCAKLTIEEKDKDKFGARRKKCMSSGMTCLLFCQNACFIFSTRFGFGPHSHPRNIIFSNMSFSKTWFKKHGFFDPLRIYMNICETLNIFSWD